MKDLLLWKGESIVNKIKGAAAIVFLSLTVYMMMTTRYAYALGDYLLLWLGLKPWSGELTGAHYTVFYFGIISIIGFILVRKYSLEKANMRARNVFLSFVVLLFLYVLLTNTAMKIVKSNSEGLLVMGLDSKDSFMRYTIKKGIHVEFEAEIDLTNYSNKLLEFKIQLINPQYDYSENDIEEYISIVDKNGNQVIFRYNGKESKTITLTLDEYKLDGEFYDGGGEIIIYEIILIDSDNNVIRLNGRDFIGIKI